MESLWFSPIYQETAALIVGSVFLIGLIIYNFRKKSKHMQAGWASVKSWLFAAPFLLVLIALPRNWTLAGLTLLSLYGVKCFFRMTGIFHRTYFVLFTYIAVTALPFLIRYELHQIYNFMPMFFLAVICLVPLLKNSYKSMIQYISLTMLNFIFFGWSIMHLGMLLFLDAEKGPYLLIYIIILTETCDTLNIAFSRLFNRRFKPFSNISQRRSLEGFILSTALTFLLAWGMRHLMPLRSEIFWLAAGFSASIAGGFGDITMSVIRRDLGIKDVGVFILGRGDFLARVDRLIFVAPIFYYLMYYLLQHSQYFG